MESSPLAKVCIILLNWNGWRDTLECLHSLVGANTQPASIIVVDNGSTDDSVERISAWAEAHFEQVPIVQPDGMTSGNTSSGAIPPFLLMCNAVNSGFAGGNNVAISWALQQDAFEFIWLLNNDTVVRPDTLETLHRCTLQHQAGVYGCTVTHADNPDVVQCAGGCLYTPLTTIFSPYLAGNTLADVQKEPEQVDFDYIFGASLYVRTEVFERCGLLNDEYFLFYEEIDLCKRACREGFSLFWCPESVVLHKGSSSVGRTESGNKPKIAFANYHENLSTLLFTRKFYPGLLPFAMLIRFFGKLTVVGKRGDWYLVRPLCRAFWDFVTGKKRGENYPA